MNYRITERTTKDKEKKKVIIADTEKLTSAEWRVIDAYLRSGIYTLEEQKPKKAKKDIGYSKAEIVAYLEKKDAEGLKEVKAMEDANEKFIKVLTWFRKKYPNYMEDRLNENK